MLPKDSVALSHSEARLVAELCWQVLPISAINVSAARKCLSHSPVMVRELDSFYNTRHSVGEGSAVTDPSYKATTVPGK